MANMSVTAAKGFTASGVASGVKRSGKLDLGLVVCPEGAKAAGVFTTNKIVSPAVEVCREHIRRGKVYAAVVNSGNANCCTGQAGMDDAVTMCQVLAGEMGIQPGQVLIASTGIIGEKLPINKVKGGIFSAISELKDSGAAGDRFAEAIMTTDMRAKQAMRQFKIGSKVVTVGGTAKGAGMIGPNMATTICVLTTDMDISKGLLGKALRDAIGGSLNKLTVDGHQSTNDTALLLASGAAGNKPVSKQGTNYRKFAKAVREVCEDLTKQMGLDAEGATRIFKVEVKGAASQAEAGQAARAVADYDLVKCAVHGGDPNWGRIICAVGSCGVRLKPEKLTCRIGGVTVFRNGQPTRFDRKKVSEIIGQQEHVISIDLGAGRGEDFCWGCDLSKDYVTINADYHT
ncbi:Arginine biosynthesis bifunctional protein ArgJ [Anaerohalosphaera lusitana]|uniref:Arginine biosynthesis bifunctional protein ArgJ n=1 Tax=Anaerohalosphaera lusitana TaxID=1936003 RepID=A0A1U9NIE8_9BACT|nr:bifunctional glutamate N-acetyltransferase/amino-acid acetyltransferase ArgJ [Anaerohalosphaera lusitana]AQT67518.1 Arginine biosynthesis bifunctional protein ArgJ [Anaerohalosphaera lusitana]